MKDIIIWNNSLLDLLVSLGIVAGGFFTAKFIYFVFEHVFGRLAKKTETELDDMLVARFREPFTFAAIIASIWWAIKRLNIPEQWTIALWKIYTVLIVLNFTWAFSRLLGTIVQHILQKHQEKKDSKFNKNVSEILQTTVTYVVWGLGILVAMHNIGIEIGTLIAGLGIGGVAVALAAQDTIKNLFGGFMLFFDRPFNIGDRIRFGSIDGYVMNIGLRSLRIRTLTNRMVTIPNSQVVDNAIENVTSEPSTKITIKLGLTYDTTPEQMDTAMSLLRNLPKSVADIEADTSVSFLEYGDFSLIINFVYFIKKNKDYYGTQSAVNMEILRQFNAAGLDFAFPTQTIYNK